MKLKKFLILLLLLISFTACVEAFEREILGRNPTPEFTVGKEHLKSKIASLLPAKEIRFSTSNTKIEGKPKYYTLHVQVIHPGTFPLNSYSFSGLADNIQRIVEKNVTNIKEFQKIEVVVRHTIEENSTKLERNYIKEVDL